MSTGGSKNRLLAALSALGVAFVSLAIYRRFFSKRKKSLQGSAAGDKGSTVGKVSEISPPFDFKTTEQDVKTEDDLIHTIITETRSAQQQGIEVIEEGNRMSRSVASVSGEHVELKIGEDEDGKPAEVSPPIDFKKPNLPSTSAAMVFARDTLTTDKQESGNFEIGETTESTSSEISPPVDFKAIEETIMPSTSSSAMSTEIKLAHGSFLTDKRKESVELDIVVATENTLAEGLPPVDFDAVEEPITPSTSCAVVFAEARPTFNSLMSTKHEKSGKLDISETTECTLLEVSPPVDFKTTDGTILPSTSGVVFAKANPTYDGFLAGKTKKSESLVCETLEDKIEVSPPVDFKAHELGKLCETPVTKDKVRASVVIVQTSATPVDTSLSDSEHSSIVADADSCVEDVDNLVTNSESKSVSVDFKIRECTKLSAKDFPSPEELSAELDLIEENLSLLPKIDLPGVSNGTSESAINMNSSRVSEDSTNGCLSTTDSGIGSVALNDVRKSSETRSVSSCISSDVDSGDGGKQINEVPAAEKGDVTAKTDLTQMEQGKQEAEPILAESPQDNSAASTFCPRETSEELFEDEANVMRQFLIPESLCGRFIGRQGKNISALKTETRTNIRVGRHFVVPGNKSCTVQGKGVDVKRALRLIQRHYPQVDVNASIPPPTLTLPQNIMQLSLPMGVFIDVVISHVVSAGHVFVQQPTQPMFTSWQNLHHIMNRSYNDSGSSAPPVPAGVEGGVLCVAPLHGQWHRAQLMSVGDDNSSCELKLLDAGGYVSVPMTALRQIKEDFMSLPFQATECYLANITPLAGDTFSEEAAEMLKSLVANQMVQCQSVAMDYHNNVPYIHIISQQNNQVVVVNRELAKQGFVKWHEMAEQ